MLISGYPWVVGKSQKEGDIQDVSIETTAEGLNRIQIARDARDLDQKIYVVDRMIKPSGAWRRLLEVESFSDNALPDNLSEVRAIVEFETIPNKWDLITEKTWGLPSGMESPWYEPIEMVGNELLLTEETTWVSGDAPVNIVKDNVYSNGKYTTTILNDQVVIEDNIGERIGSFSTDTDYLSWTEGIAGAAFFNGGSIYIEPAKPPLFLGVFTLHEDPIPIQPGLYHYGDHYIISSIPLSAGRGIGAIAFVKDPYPQRWINKIFCRAYVQLISPANIPPLVEDLPRRISIEAYPVPTDFKDITPRVVTPYANKTGIFNIWDVDIPAVIYKPRERPYDVLLPFKDGKVEDWGGLSVRNTGTFFPALDYNDDPDASFPTYIPYEMPDIPEMYEGTAFYRWKDSSAFQIIKTEWLKITYREGYVYFENKISPDSTGIAPIEVSGEWNNTKIEWTSNTLYVNDEPALIEEIPWGEILDEPRKTWGEIADIPPSQWTRDGSFPTNIEQYEEIPPTWETGYPEGEVDTPDPDYSNRPRTWGRILYEELYVEEV